MYAVKQMRKKMLVHYERMMNVLALWGNKEYYIMFICLKVIMDLFFVLALRKAYPSWLVVGNAFKYIFSWIIAGTMAVFMPRTEGSLKSFFLHIQFIFMILPMLTVYAFTENKSTKYMLMVALAIMVEILIIKAGRKKYKAVSIKNLHPYVSVFLMIAIPLSMILIFFFGGFSGLKAFDFVELYKIRESANYPAILSYIIMWYIHLIAPFYIGYCLERKCYIFALLLIVNSFILYMVVAQKFIYLSLLVTLSVYFASKTKYLIRVMYIGTGAGLIVLTILICIEPKQNLSDWLIIAASFVGDRFLFGPAHNKFIYSEVFSRYPKIHLADSLIGKCMGLTNMYQYGSGQMVFAYGARGRYGDSNSCTGYLGDGYAEFGFWGILIGAIILVLLIRYVDNYCDSIAFAVLAVVIANYVIALNDAPLQTVLCSGGFFLFLFFLAVYAEPKKKERR